MFLFPSDRIDRRSRVQFSLRTPIEAPRRRFCGNQASKARGVFTVRFSGAPSGFRHSGDSIRSIASSCSSLNSKRSETPRGRARRTPGECRAFSCSERRACRSNEHPSLTSGSTWPFRFSSSRCDILARKSPGKSSRQPSRAGTELCRRRRGAWQLLWIYGDLGESHIAQIIRIRCDVA